MGDDREEIARLSQLRDALNRSAFVMDAVREVYSDSTPMGVRLRKDLDAILARQGQPTSGDDREEIARITSRIEEEREKAASYPLGDPMCSRHGGIRDGLKEALEIILARQGPGPGEAVALKWEESLRPDEFEANTPFGRYFVCNLRGYHRGYGVRFMGFGVAGKFNVHDFETPQQAVAAGNAHWASMLAHLYAATPTREG